jgi:hypothetical protein
MKSSAKRITTRTAAKKPRAKANAKTAVRRVANKVRSTAKKVASKASRATKSKRTKVVVPAIEPPRPGATRAKPARPVGHAPLRRGRSASPALSLAGGGIAVPRRAR